MKKFFRILNPKNWFRRNRQQTTVISPSNDVPLNPDEIVTQKTERLSANDEKLGKLASLIVPLEKIVKAEAKALFGVESGRPKYWSKAKWAIVLVIVAIAELPFNFKSFEMLDLNQTLTYSGAIFAGIMIAILAHVTGKFLRLKQKAGAFFTGIFLLGILIVIALMRADFFSQQAKENAENAVTGISITLLPQLLLSTAIAALGVAAGYLHTLTIAETGLMENVKNLKQLMDQKNKLVSERDFIDKDAERQYNLFKKSELDKKTKEEEKTLAESQKTENETNGKVLAQNAEEQRQQTFTSTAGALIAQISQANKNDAFLLATLNVEYQELAKTAKTATELTQLVDIGKMLDQKKV